MSDLQRLERIAKSLIPRIPRGANRQYKLEDARNMINDLGMQLSPEALAFLIDNDVFLDDFLMGVYHLEGLTGQKVTTDFATIDDKFSPKAYEQDGKIVFTAMWKDKERVFAEFSR